MQVNVLVHIANTNRFRLFRQRKYGYEGLSYDVIGGQVEAGE